MTPELGGERFELLSGPLTVLLDDPFTSPPDLHLLHAALNIRAVSGGIFPLRGEDELVEMRESPYEAEDVLQALIARFPSLLAGDQYSANSPRRWMLVGREAALPDDEDAAGRWSVDHLFLDQDAVPTLVEVKRSSDTWIRREVVGQMLLRRQRGGVLAAGAAARAVRAPVRARPARH